MEDLTIKETRNDSEGQGYGPSRAPAPTEGGEGFVHTPVAVDPLEEMQKAVETMQHMLTEREQELEKVRQDLQNSQSASAQNRNNATHLARMLKQEQEGRKADRKFFTEKLDRVRKHVHKPILWPVILAVACGVLSLLVGICIDGGLMTCILGDPLAAGLLAACALFAGVTYERLRLR